VCAKSLTLTCEIHRLERAREVFRGHTADLDRRGIKHKEVVVFGDPRDKIIEVAAECGVANIIIGSRGLGAVKRMVLGSVAEYVVKHAACHVIVARSSTAGDIRK
jgi:nucleotide-binding universal stress UspA family protein